MRGGARLPGRRVRRAGDARLPAGERHLRQRVLLLRACSGPPRAGGAGARVPQPPGPPASLPASRRALPGDELPATLRKRLRHARSADGLMFARAPDPAARQDAGAGKGKARSRLLDGSGGAAGALPAALQAAGGPQLPGLARRDQLLGPDRFPRPPTRLLPLAALPLGQRGEGDAAGRISAPDRQPDADPLRARAPGPMIKLSDNGRANAIYHRVGDSALLRLASLVHMRTFTVAYCWGCAFFSAADQARFFYNFDRLVPPRSRRYARHLLSSIVAYQRWGFSRYSLAHGFKTFFKGGWRGTGRGRLVHEAAMFERGLLRFSMAVLTDGNPSHGYGTATLRGVAARIFGSAPARSAQTPAHRRAGLVDVHRFGTGIRTGLVYRTNRNITGHRLPGYCREWALMLEPAARDLGRVQRYLRRRGLGLLILDAYRPARATRALVRWAERTGRGDLVGTYIARRSNHNLGSAVDLTLVRLSDGRRLRLGRFDALGPGAHTLDARGRVLRNRLILKGAMERFGFTNYWREWWHFDHRVRGTRHLDLTLGCG